MKIFIIGISRTGSKFYMQLLNSSAKINIAPEFNFKHPFKKSVFSLINDDLKSKKIDSIIKSIYSQDNKDTLISSVKKINQLELKKRLLKYESISEYDVLSEIILLLCSSENKIIPGAKFPVHYSYAKELIHFIEGGTVLYLTRDPREIYFSDFTKKKKEKAGKGNAFPVKGWLLKPAVLFYSILEWRNSINTYQELISDSTFKNKIRLFKYEDILNDEDQVLSNIADFLNLPKSDFNLNELKVVDSSFSKKPELGRWKNKLNWLEKLIFKVFIGRKMRKFGY